MKKIIWIADFTTEDHQGGAQQTNKMVIDSGLKKGLDIEVVKCKDFEESMISDDVLFIINNIIFLRPDRIELLARKAKYVRYCHDYSCSQKLSVIPQFYSNSLLNIFLSPLHHKAYQKEHGINISNVSYQNSPIDTKVFKIKGDDRRHDEAIWVGQFAPHKGLENVAKYAREHPRVNIKIYGFGQVELLNSFSGLKNIKLMGEIKHEEISDIYRKSGGFIHLPNWKEPFGRTILEAYLCGCDLIINDNMGCMSFGWDWSDYDFIKKQCDEASNNFWKKLKKIIK